MNVYMQNYMIALGLLITASIYIGEEVGKNNLRQAKRYSTLIQIMTLTISLVTMLICSLLGYNIASIFTEIEYLRANVSELFILVIPLAFIADAM
jgi:Na+-driven multidrug efflux pump